MVWALAISTCYFDLQEVYLGACPGMGSLHSSHEKDYLGEYPVVGDYPGDYGRRPIHEIKSLKFSFNTMLLYYYFRFSVHRVREELAGAMCWHKHTMYIPWFGFNIRTIV